MAGNSLKVTTFKDLKGYANGTVVELPPFAEGKPFVARLKRPSFLGMVKRGKIPNTLLVKANELFLQSGGFDVEEEDAMSQLFDVLDIIAEETFVEPTYEQIKGSGIELTDDQMMFVYNYSQQGVKALESFRNE